jgi:DNA-binding FadR family transcriptional regulator
MALTRRATRIGVQRVRDFITDAASMGTLPPGGKLPTERELAERFAVPRHAVRRTLSELEAEGSITRHVGRGTFLVPAATPPLEDLPTLSAMHTGPAELMEARLQIEPVIAELIATNATAADFERMEACPARAESAPTLDEFEQWDAALHHAFATATHNRFIVRVFEMVAAVREQAEWGKLKDRIVTPERRIQYQQEHRAIVDALKARDADGARQSMLAHLHHARRNLFGFG